MRLREEQPARNKNRQTSFPHRKATEQKAEC